MTLKSQNETLKARVEKLKAEKARYYDRLQSNIAENKRKDAVIKKLKERLGMAPGARVVVNLPQSPRSAPLAKSLPTSPQKEQAPLTPEQQESVKLEKSIKKLNEYIVSYWMNDEVCIQTIPSNLDTNIKKLITCFKDTGFGSYAELVEHLTEYYDEDDSNCEFDLDIYKSIRDELKECKAPRLKTSSKFNGTPAP